jgi:hypothetical protein
MTQIKRYSFTTIRNIYTLARNWIGNVTQYRKSQPNNAEHLSISPNEQEEQLKNLTKVLDENEIVRKDVLNTLSSSIKNLTTTLLNKLSEIGVTIQGALKAIPQLVRDELYPLAKTSITTYCEDKKCTEDNLFEPWKEAGAEQIDIEVDRNAEEKPAIPAGFFLPLK